MKRMKKILAMVMAMAMVLGMSLTAFAANATLTITNAENASFKKLQVIAADPSTATGWAFTDENVAVAYISAFSTVEEGDMPKVVSDQEAIVMLILAGGVAKEELPVAFKDTDLEAASAAQIGRALSNVGAAMSDSFTDMTNGETVTSAGIYAIKGEEEGFTYNNMAIYVGFGPVDGENYPELTSEPIAAKKSPTTTSKVVADEDKVVAIGDIITYTITAQVPFIDPNNVNKSFTITDEIKGATYYFPKTQEEMENGSWDDSIASVQMNEGNGEVSGVGSAELFAVKTDGTGFTIDLSNLINDANSNAGKELTVTYTAKVTETTVENTAQGHAGGSDFSSSPEVNVYSGSIVLAKVNENGDALNNAEFTLSKVTGTDAEGNPVYGDPLKFVLQVDGTYKYAPEATAENATILKSATVQFADEEMEGVVVVTGLDVGEYHFTETKAPEGYSINTDGAGTTISVLGEARDVIVAHAQMTDTTLNALPSTGGIGTTIFTIGGVAIMVVAAGLFFATRKKSSK